MALDAADSYFSLDDILATNEKIPCKVELPIYRLGRYRFTRFDSLNRSGSRAFSHLFGKFLVRHVVPKFASLVRYRDKFLPHPNPL